MKELKLLLSFKKSAKLNGGYILSLAISVILALLVGAAIMAVCGHDPIAAYASVIEGALGSNRAIGDTLAKSATLCLLGLAMAVAAQAGIFNVGGEGQLFLGAMASAVIGAYLTGWPAFVAVPIAIIAAIAAGAIYAWIPAWLKVKLNVNEVVTTIMMNSAAIYFCKFLSSGPFKTAERGISSGTTKLDAGFAFSKVIPLSNLTVSIFISAFVALAVWYLMKKTTIGYEMDMSGKNRRFAEYMGIKSGKLMIISMLISGGICGLTGMFEVYGIHKRFIEAVSREFYYDGMLVAMIVRYNPVGIILMSLFFGILKIGATGMEKMGIPSEIMLIIQSIVIFFMAAENGITKMIKDRLVRVRARREAIERSARV
ncbi:MAG: ABC transporter permease [Clostridia bacterium]|nr:ABC transporter permease [Clostridia bacterium]